MENLAWDENYAISHINNTDTDNKELLYCIYKGVYFGIPLTPFSKRYLSFIKPLLNEHTCD